MTVLNQKDKESNFFFFSIQSLSPAMSSHSDQNSKTSLPKKTHKSLLPYLQMSTLEGEGDGCGCLLASNSFSREDWGSRTGRRLKQCDCTEKHMLHENCVHSDGEERAQGLCQPASSPCNWMLAVNASSKGDLMQTQYELWVSENFGSFGKLADELPVLPTVSSQRSPLIYTSVQLARLSPLSLSPLRPLH